MNKSNLADLENIMAYGKWALAALAAFLQGVPELTWLLIGLMALDTLFGVGVAVKQRNLSATAMWQGATKKIGSLGFIVLAGLLNRYVNIQGMDFVQIATAFYIGPELLSILRNAAILEVPVPPQITQVLRVFNQEPKK